MMEYDPEEGRLHLLQDAKAPNATSGVASESREVPLTISTSQCSRIYTSTDAAEDRTEKEKDLDLLEKLALEF